jgi:hypothetical protein
MFARSLNKPSLRLASVLVFFQLGVVVLACPMPMHQAMPESPAMAVECSETHSNAASEQMPNELCKARMAGEATALVKDRPSDASAPIADPGHAQAVVFRAVPVRAQFGVKYALSVLPLKSPPHLKFQVIRI